MSKKEYEIISSNSKETLKLVSNSNARVPGKLIDASNTLSIGSASLCIAKGVKDYKVENYWVCRKKLCKINYNFLCMIVSKNNCNHLVL